jgi:hypothetical protein
MTDIATNTCRTGGGAAAIDAMGSRILLQRIRGEYLEMPGLALTLPQAARLWGLSVGQTELLVLELVRRGFLMRDMKGAYRRLGCPRCS